MKNIRQELGDSLRPEYERSDFGEMVRGKYAARQIEFAELVRLLLACIGEDEGLNFARSSAVSRRPGDWTYELDNSNQITLRYWRSESENIEEPVSNPPCVNNAQERSDLQHLLLNHARALKTRVETLKR